MFFLVPLLVEVAAVPGMVALLAAQLDLQAGKTSELVQHLTTVRESVEQCRAALQHMQDCRPQVSRNQTKPNQTYQVITVPIPVNQVEPNQSIYPNSKLLKPNQCRCFTTSTGLSCQAGRTTPPCQPVFFTRYTVCTAINAIQT